MRKIKLLSVFALVVLLLSIGSGVVQGRELPPQVAH